VEIAYWVGINIAIGVFGPVIVGRTFVRYNKSKPSITLRQFYAKGELGLASLLIALSVIVDVNKSHSSPPVRQMMIPCLSIFAFASALVWAIPLCNSVAKVSVDWKKVWRDSWRVAVVVFSVGLVTEVLLELAS
jgi:hypothetical protein